MEPDPVVCSILNSPHRMGAWCALRRGESTGNWTRFPWDISGRHLALAIAPVRFPRYPVAGSGLYPEGSGGGSIRPTITPNGRRVRWLSPAAANNGRSTQHATSCDRCRHFRKGDRLAAVFSGPTLKAHLRSPSGFHPRPPAKIRNRPCHSLFAVSHPTWHRAQIQRQHVG